MPTQNLPNSQTRNLPHIQVVKRPKTMAFRPVVGGGSSTSREVADRKKHGLKLQNEYNQAVGKSEETQEESGSYVTFTSFPGFEIVIESLDSGRDGDYARVVTVQRTSKDDEDVQNVTVYIPHGDKGTFLKKLDAYIDSVKSESDSPKHKALIESIASIHKATIRDLWTDPVEEFPEDPTQLCWWEVWLRVASSKEKANKERTGNEYERLRAYARQHELLISSHYLGFRERTVVLLRATAEQLSHAFDSIDDFAELRWPHEIASFLSDMTATEQQEWIDDLSSRLECASAESPAVCLLDTGVQPNHQLLSHSLLDSEHYTADPSWAKNPTDPHGTEMAGLALYGDLQAAITGTGKIELKHRLESVKLLPDNGDNDPDVYGAVTARAVSQPEISEIDRARVFMLAVTAPASKPDSNNPGDKDRKQESGKPTAWSATVDALSFGRAIDDTASAFAYLSEEEKLRPRLFVVSAGNIRDVRAEDDPLARCDAESVEDPAQAWNALTVGAYAEHDSMMHADQSFRGYTPIVPRGELSPSSRTSVSFDRRKWPFKPEVVAPGGNLAYDAHREKVDSPENLAILTTRYRRPGQGYFTTTRDTSAATAQVASLAADIMAAYPGLRPETIRALIVHSAEWTEKMQEHLGNVGTKADRVNLLRRYGMGVPDLSRATRSARNAMTLFTEAVIHPFEREGNQSAGKAREMHLHELPWPRNALEALGEAEVKLRVTLSYFVEPNPSNRGWSGKYAYPSYGLRFAMKRSDESITAFNERINLKARDESFIQMGTKPESGWFFGADQQKAAGSLHTDIWQGTATELANKEAIAVYPVSGWWKNKPNMDQSNNGVHYSLVASIESAEVDVDLWTPVKQIVEQQIQPPVELQIGLF